MQTDRHLRAKGRWHGFGLKLLFICLAFVCTFLHTWSAHARRSTTISVKLVSAAGEEPTAVCVFTGAGHDDQKFNGRTTDEFHFTMDADGFYRVSIGDEPTDGCKNAGGKTSCEPRFAFDRGVDASDAYVRCVSNRRKSATTARILVLQLGHVAGREKGKEDVEASHPNEVRVDKLILNGPTLEIQTSLPARASSLLLEVIGGYYRADARIDIAAIRTQELPTLSLQPSCAWMMLERPPMLLGNVPPPTTEGSASVGVSPNLPGSPATIPWKLTMKSGESNPVELKNCPTRGERHKDQFEIWVPVEVSNETSITLELDGSEFSGSWMGVTPQELYLAPKKFTFSWEVDSCHYWAYENACPTARIRESGVECSLLPDENACRYVCPGDGKSLASLDMGNVHITLTGARPNQEMTWSLPLRTIGQTLQGYVAAGERRISVRRRLSPDGVGNDEVRTVEFSYVAENGATVRQTAEFGRHSSRYVALPGVGCGANLEYRYVGDRAYHSDTKKLEAGRLEIESPDTLAREAYFVGHVGAGTLFPRMVFEDVSGAPRLYLAIEGELGVGYWPLPRPRGWRFEFRFGAMYSLTPVQPIDRIDVQQSSGGMREIPYIRATNTFQAISPWFFDRKKLPGMAVGLGFGPLIGRPLFQHDAPLFDPTSQSFDFGVRTLLELRLRLSRRARIEFYSRGSFIFAEDHVAFKTDLKGDAMRVLREHMAVRSTLTFGLAFSL